MVKVKGSEATEKKEDEEQKANEESEKEKEKKIEEKDLLPIDDTEDKDLRLKQVRLEELMADLKLEDAEDNQELHENVDVVEDFIKKMEKVKIDID